MNAVRAHLTRALEERLLQPAHQRRAKRNRTRHPIGDRAHTLTDRSTPPFLPAIR